jgi:hypothetical protein
MKRKTFHVPQAVFKEIILKESEKGVNNHFITTHSRLLLWPPEGLNRSL